jgi:hypothetical protein
LADKLHLTSILHEVGHEALVALRMVGPLGAAMRAAVIEAGGSGELAEWAESWASEIGADLWGVCAVGLAATATTREILALRCVDVFRATWLDPHPPPDLRVLLGCAWCREAFGGTGPWDDWERDWLATYPLSTTPASARSLVSEARELRGVLARATLRTRFQALGGRAIADLFDLAALRPHALKGVLATLSARGPTRPCVELAAFRAAQETGATGSATDARMTAWLTSLNERRERSLVRANQAEVTYGS